MPVPVLQGDRDGAGGVGGFRADSSGRSTPGFARRGWVQAPVNEEEVPMADPVRIQSMAAVILIGLLVLVMIGGLVAFVVHAIHGNQPQDNQANTAEEPPKVLVDVYNPFKKPEAVKGPVVSDVHINSPILYIIDCGSLMQESGMLDMSVQIVRASVRSLDEQQKFNVIMSMAENTEPPPASLNLPAGAAIMATQYTAGGKDAVKTAWDFMRKTKEMPHCGTSRVDVVPSIKSALDMSPKTIVVFTNKQLESIDPLVAAAKSAGIKLVTMGMTNDGLRAGATGQDLQDRGFGKPGLHVLPAPGVAGRDAKDRQ